jgi:hypothetical protein
MKIILQIILGLLITQNCFSQTDTVLLSVNSKLISEYQIIYQQENIGTREYYTYFKHRFWLQKTDTILMDKLIKTDNGFKENKSRKPLTYQKYGICDSIINHIRNSSSYWRMLSNIYKQTIGHDNKEFNTYKQSQDSNNLYTFSKKCFNEYKKDEDVLKQKLLNKIKSIDLAKSDRFEAFNNMPSEIDKETISVFLSTFNQCVFDFKSLEVIIINKPNELIQELEKLDDMDFFIFTLKLDEFPENSNLVKMTDSLKKIEIKSVRKKKLIRKMKITKG